MASSAVLELTDDNFKTEVLQSDKPTLVDFWAEWCQPCKFLAPTIDELAEEYEGQVKVGKIDVDSNREHLMQYGIQAIPTVILFQNGEVVQKFGGVTSKDAIKAELDKVSA